MYMFMYNNYTRIVQTTNLRSLASYLVTSHCYHLPHPCRRWPHPPFPEEEGAELRWQQPGVDL